MDQLSLGQVLRRPTLATIQCRRTNRHQPLIEQPEPLTVGWKFTAAQQNRAVERLTVKIHRIHVHPYAGELYPILLLGQMETLQYLQQPAHSQRGRRLEPEITLPATHRSAGAFNAAKACPEFMRQPPPRISQRQPRAGPLE